MLSVIPNSSYVWNKPPMIHFRFILCQMSEKKLLKFWDQDKIIRAVGPAREKEMGFKKDQKMFNVPKISLRRYVNLQ